MELYVRLGEAVARTVPGVGWRITHPGNLPDFRRLMTLLREVEAAEVSLDEAAQKYRATVEYVALAYEG